METMQQWINTEYLQTCRDYATYLNHLSILLITASAIVAYKTRDIYSLTFWISALGFVFGIINLILGLNLYGDLLGIILDFSHSKPDLTKLRPWILWQFWLDLGGLTVVILAFLILKRGGNRK